MADANYGRRLSIILETCPYSMAEISRKTGVGYSTILQHHQWMKDPTTGREFKGMVSPGIRSAITRVANQCIEDYPDFPDLPYRDRKLPVHKVWDKILIEQLVELPDITPIEPIDVVVEPEYNYYEFEVVWYGKHGGPDQHSYTEEFSATLHFRLHDDTSESDAMDIGQDAMDSALAQVGYPGVTGIQRHWHTMANAVGIRKLSKDDAEAKIRERGAGDDEEIGEKPVFSIVQTDSGSPRRKGYIMHHPIAKDIDLES